MYKNDANNDKSEVMTLRQIILFEIKIILIFNVLYRLRLKAAQNSQFVMYKTSNDIEMK